jgi:hypothetical protein
VTVRVLAAVVLAGLAVIAAVGAVDPRDAAVGWMVGQRLATSVAMGSLLWLAVCEIAPIRRFAALSPAVRTSGRRPAWAVAVLLLGVPAWCPYALDAWMTLDPGWKSSVPALVVVAAGVRDGLAALILLTAATARTTRLPPDLWHALGRLVLTTVLLSAYLPFSHLLAIGSGGLPAEIGDFAARWHGSARIASLALIALTAGIALLPLVSRPFDRPRLAIVVTAAEVLFLGALEAAWDLVPHGHPAVAGALAAVSVAAWGAGIAAATWWAFGDAEDVETSLAHRGR